MEKYAVIAGRERGKFISRFSLKAGMLKNERSPQCADPNVCANGKYQGSEPVCVTD